MSKVRMTYLILFIVLDVFGQTYVYDIEVFGKKIGEVIATKTIAENNTITYVSNSKSEVNFLGKKEIITTMKTVYENNVLQSSYYEVKKNNKVKEKATILYQDGTYQILTNGKKTLFDKPVKKSTIMLTYQLPVDGEKIFEEVGGYYKTIKKVGVDKFYLVDSKSSYVDTYIYNQQGVLKKCIIRKALINFQMVLQEKTKSY